MWRAQLPKPGRKAAPPVRLLSSTRWDFGPRYSPDGRRIAFQSDRGGDYDIWIYFASNRTGTYQVWKAPTGGGDAVRVTRKGGFAASESPVLPSVVFHNFEVMPDGFIGRPAPTLALRFHALADGTTRTIVPVKEGYVGLSVSPDRESALYTVRNPEGSNLSRVEDFR